MQKLYLIFGVVMSSVLLSSCAPFFIGGVVTGGVVAANQRTAATQLEDAQIEIKAEIEIGENIADQARYSITSINRVALVVGQAPTQSIKDQITGILVGIDNVRQVQNQMTIGEQISLGAQLADAGITSSVKANMIGAQKDNFSALDIKVITEDKVVYLMGLVSREHAAKAVDITRQTSSVLRVVHLFEYIESAPNS